MFVKSSHSDGIDDDASKYINDVAINHAEFFFF